MVSATLDYYNAANTTVSFNVEVDVVDNTTGSNIHSQSYELTAGGESSGTTTFDISVDIPAGETHDIEVCITK
jgi:hypothetical protein